MKHGIIFKKWSNCGVTCKILWDDISGLYRFPLETGTNTRGAHPSRHCFLSIYWLPARPFQPFSGCFYFRTSKSHTQEIVYGLSPVVVEFSCTAERIQELGMGEGGGELASVKSTRHIWQPSFSESTFTAYGEGWPLAHLASWIWYCTLWSLACGKEPLTGFS